MTRLQITVKVKPHATKNATAIVRECVKAAQPDATVEEVFPGVESGRRAGLVVVCLPPGASEKDSRALLTRLRDTEEIEYAEPAPARKAR
jgi:beta-phosphoglucomutase-like phosphatase (HAD superfamily)